MHIAAIYTETTADEKATFAHVKLESGELAEDKVDWLIDQFVGTNGLALELINETIAKCK